MWLDVYQYGLLALVLAVAAALVGVLIYAVGLKRGWWHQKEMAPYRHGGGA